MSGQPSTINDDRSPDLHILRDIDRNGSLLDATLLALVPILLTGIFVVAPDGSQWTLKINDPSLQAVILAHYFHTSTAHFLGNIVAYLILAPTLYMLAVLCGWRRPFMALFGIISVVFPVPLSALYLVLLPTGEILGYSALTLAFLGTVPVVLVRYLRVQYDVTMSPWHSLGLFIVGVGLITGPAVAETTRNTQLLTVGMIVVGAGYSLWLIRDAVSGGGETSTRRGYEALAVLGAVVFVTVGVLSTSSSGPTAGVALIHLLGYVLGFGSAVVGVTLS
jgi:hypothetical protein